MKIGTLFLFLSLLGLSLSAPAKKLSDYQPYAFEVLFTNPVCELYSYAEPVLSRSGERLLAKPKNVYCKKSDRKKYELPIAEVAEQFASHPELTQILQSPQFKILQWIEDPQAKEVFLAYLTFSNRVVADALCRRVKEDGLKVTLVVDKGALRRTGDELTAAETLAMCQASDGAKPLVIVAGDQSGLGFQHNKMILINPSSGAENHPAKIIFSSGNMTSGTSMSHENWNFVTTSSQSYFSQMHFCVMQTLLNENSRSTKAAYIKGIAGCRQRLAGAVAPEEDIEMFFVPGEGELATRRIAEELAQADGLGLASHRISYKELFALISRKAQSLGPAFNLRMLFDDDLYLVGKKELKVGAVPNMPAEFYGIMKLQKQLKSLGSQVQTKYLQTSHSERLLFHNKILLFSKQNQAFSAFIGAGNFTDSAFIAGASSTNFENFYLVKDLQVVSAYQRQFEQLFLEMASFEEQLPQGAPQP